MDKKYKLHSTVIKANDDGSIRFRLIDKTLDSDSEVLLPDGARTDRIKKNPVWLWCHNIEMWGGTVRPPIGKMLLKTIEKTEKFFDVDVMFDEMNDDFAKMVAAKHRSGFLNACSVGFDPITVSRDTVYPNQQGVTYEEFMINEGSSVPIPANPNALQQKEWGEFLETCEKSGLKLSNMKAMAQKIGWEPEIVEDAFPEKTQVPVEEKISEPYDFTKDVAEVRQRVVRLCEESKNVDPEILKDGAELINEMVERLIETIDIEVKTKPDEADEEFLKQLDDAVHPKENELLTQLKQVQDLIKS